MKLCVIIWRQSIWKWKQKAKKMKIIWLVSIVIWKWRSYVMTQKQYKIYLKKYRKYLNNINGAGGVWRNNMLCNEMTAVVKKSGWRQQLLKLRAAQWRRKRLFNTLAQAAIPCLHLTENSSKQTENWWLLVMVTAFGDGSGRRGVKRPSENMKTENSQASWNSEKRKTPASAKPNSILAMR